MIDIQNLSFRYNRHREVLSGISCTLDKGHIHGLLGCNGIGKSTLIRLMCGLLRPDKGTLTVAGIPAQERRVDLLSDLFYVPDEVSLPDIPMARFAAITAPFYPAFSHADFQRYAAELGVNPQARPGGMSLGERKKSYLAFALACNTAYLLLDEPTNGLDIPSKATFRRLLAQYATDERTIVLATHQIREIEELLDNIVICDKQGLVLAASVTTLSQRLNFGPLAENTTALYRETTLTGDVGITENRTGTESRPRLEILFNAISHDRNTIPSILKNKAQSHE